jgi:ATP-dependent Clp protease adaptor protein ClpS
MSISKKLRRALDLSLADLEGQPIANGDVDPFASGEVQAVIHQAVVHVESIGHEVVTGAHVLVETLDRWPGSFLQEQGMTRYAAANFICHGIANPGMAAPPSEGESGTPSGSDAVEDASQAATFKVLLLNDDYTPMDFVVHVLERFFDMDRETAARIMLHVHNHGSAECGAFLHAVAAAKVREVSDFAREHQHPLRCVLQAN